MHQGQYNWFAVVDFIECEVISDSVFETHLNDFYSFALELPIQSQQKEQLVTSHAAFLASLPDPAQCRIASMLNGDIVTDSESDSAEGYVGVTSVKGHKLSSPKRGNA